MGEQQISRPTIESPFSIFEIQRNDSLANAIGPLLISVVPDNVQALDVNVSIGKSHCVIAQVPVKVRDI